MLTLLLMFVSLVTFVWHIYYKNHSLCYILSSTSKYESFDLTLVCYQSIKPVYFARYCSELYFIYRLPVHTYEIARDINETPFYPISLMVTKLISHYLCFVDSPFSFYFEVHLYRGIYPGGKVLVG